MSRIAYCKAVRSSDDRTLTRTATSGLSYSVGARKFQARVPLIQRAQIPRPLLDLNDRQWKAHAEQLPVQEQPSGAPVAVKEGMERFKTKVSFRRHKHRVKRTLPLPGDKSIEFAGHMRRASMAFEA